MVSALAFYIGASVLFQEMYNKASTWGCTLHCRLVTVCFAVRHGQGVLFQQLCTLLVSECFSGAAVRQARPGPALAGAPHHHQQLPCLTPALHTAPTLPAGGAAPVPPGLGEDPRPPPLWRHRHPQGPGAQGALASGFIQSVSFQHTHCKFLATCGFAVCVRRWRRVLWRVWRKLLQLVEHPPNCWAGCIQAALPLSRAAHTLRISLRPLRPAIAGRGRAGVSSAAYLSTQARNHPAQSPLWGQLTRLPVRTHKLKTFFPTTPCTLGFDTLPCIPCPPFIVN